jgi:hypothetical protein
MKVKNDVSRSIHDCPLNVPYEAPPKIPMPHRGFHDIKNGGFSTIDGISRNHQYPLTPDKPPESEQTFSRTSSSEISKKNSERKKQMKIKMNITHTTFAAFALLPSRDALR